MTYRTLTYSKKLGACGRLYVLFLEGEEGEFVRLFIKGAMNKNTPCGDAWLEPMSKLLTFSLRRGIYEGSVDRGILKHLKGTRCNNVSPNKEHNLSCPDALAKIIEEYLASKSPNLVGKAL